MELDYGAASLHTGDTGQSFHQISNNAKRVVGRLSLETAQPAHVDPGPPGFLTTGQTRWVGGGDQVRGHASPPLPLGLFLPSGLHSQRRPYLILLSQLTNKIKLCQTLNVFFFLSLFDSDVHDFMITIIYQLIISVQVRKA